MIGTTKRVAVCAALLALGGAMIGCGDDDDGGGVDAGRDSGTVDSGSGDSGPVEVDSGTDAGGTDAGSEPAFIRLANLISNVPDPAGIHVCIQQLGAATQQLITRTSAGPTSVPYGGISNYTNALMFVPLDYTVRGYAAGDVEGMTCPAATEAIFEVTIDPTLLTGGEYFTIAAVGRVDGEGAAAATLAIISDDNTEPADGQTRVRVVHGVVGAPAVDVCYDPDYVPGAAPMPGPMPATSIASDLTYIGSATEILEIPYNERAPMGTGDPGGALLVYLAASNVDCADPGTTPTAIPAIPLPFPVPPAPPNLTGTVNAGDVVTLFFRGFAGAPSVIPASCTPPAAGGTQPAVCTAQNAAAICHPVAMRCIHPEAPSLTPWIDDLGITRE